MSAGTILRSHRGWENGKLRDIKPVGGVLIVLTVQVPKFDNTVNFASFFRLLPVSAGLSTVGLCQVLSARDLSQNFLRQADRLSLCN